MNIYKLIIAYDGTDYAGWQYQPQLPSVEHALKKTFTKIFNREPYFLGASRTDAGVHAFGQVAVCRTDLDIAPDALCRIWNNSLPPDIRIRTITRVDDTFHPQANVITKEYHYHFFTERPLPFVQRYGLYYPQPIDMQDLQRALQLFVGTHDFKAFCVGGGVENKKGTVRTIDSIDLDWSDELQAHRIVVHGERFLRHMIRRIVGAALHVASNNRYSFDILKQILSDKNPNHPLPNAAAQGLMLYTIVYGEKNDK